MIPAILCGFIVLILLNGLLLCKIRNKKFKLAKKQKFMLAIIIIFYIVILYLSLTGYFLQ